MTRRPDGPIRGTIARVEVNGDLIGVIDIATKSMYLEYREPRRPWIERRCYRP